MKPIIKINNDIISIVGHYDDVIKCAKLSLLCDLYHAKRKNGEATLQYNENFIKDLQYITADISFAQPCGDQCTAACTKGCGEGCQASCSPSGTCGSSCGQACAWNCGGACGERCGSGCTGGCTNECEGCTGGCGVVCGNACRASCGYDCGGAACAPGCGAGCSPGCGGSCGDSCSTGCGYGCDYQCVSCGGSCDTGCTTTCTGSCKDTCTGSCKDTCTGTCKNSCTGCSGKCNTNCDNGCSGGNVSEVYNRLINLNPDDLIKASDVTDLEVLIRNEMQRRSMTPQSHEKEIKEELITDVPWDLMLADLDDMQKKVTEVNPGDKALKTLIKSYIACAVELYEAIIHPGA